METEKIKKAIIQNYVHGAFNETNINAFKTIFHPEFSIINIQENGQFYLFTRDMWEEALEKRRRNKDFDYDSIALTPTFRIIEVENEKAVVVIDLRLRDKLVYTDFLLLIKVENQWQIVSKIYKEHSLTQAR